MSKRLKLPLKIKVISLIVLLLGSALIFFTSFSVDLFKKDKAAYIYETSLATSETIQRQLDQYFAKTIKDFLLINKILESKSSTQIAKQVFLGHTEALLFKKKKTTFHNPTQLESMKLSKDQLAELSVLNLPLLTKSLNGVEIRGVELDGQTLFHLSKEKNSAELFISSQKILLPLEENKIYDSFLFSSTQSKMFPKEKNGFNPIIISELLKDNPLSKSVREVELNGQAFLLSYSKLRSFDFHALSLIRQEKAFRAATFLSKKSLYFGMMVLGVGIVLGVLFSRSLTKPLEVLYEGTQKMASGDFSTKVQITSRDEIGSLSQSFNFMSSEILRYMEEMKEKARLENEVAVAKLVQDSFFPPMDFLSDKIELSAFYTPASECGGDWFQIHRHENKTILIIADATGHGVPAAFLTASIYTAFNSLIENSDINQDVLSSSSKLMENINNVICMMDTNLYLTCFAAIIDENSGEMVYSNASHMDPFLIHEKAGGYDKSDLLPLIEAKGSRLGHKSGSTYPENKMTLKTNDTLVFLTDGILESQNVEEKQYGQRRFIKSLCQHLHSSPALLRDALVGDLKDFCGTVPFDDDVTLIVTRIK